MKSRRRFGWLFAGLLFVLVQTGILLAQDQGDLGIPTNIGSPSNAGSPNAGSPNNDPPARVARLQYISGEVSLQPGGVNDWVAANLNRPLTTSDRVWTDKDSRAELNVGTGFLRMNSESSLTLSNVSDNTIQAQLDQGVLELTVRHLEPGEVYEVDTPNLAFTVMKAGVYRFDVNPNDDQTWVTVRKGYGEATGRGPAVKVSDGQQVRFSSQNSLQHEAFAAPVADGFDDWAKVRDKRFDSSVSARYVAPGVIGYEDLDTYGSWRAVSTYGNVWFPRGVAVGWAPYRYGHWAWVAPWGWTWVDDASWGFAPFHYGRWVYWGGAWGWAPGPVYAGWRPFYAPALVGWIGGGGWGLSIGFGIGGGCGWFPLGWGEAYYPWYHGYRGGYVSQNYIRNVNVTNTHITNITNVTNNYYNNSVNNTHYANRTVAGAVTAAPRSALASGQNIARVGSVVPRADLGKGQVVRNVDVAPTRQAVLGGNTPRNTAIPPASAVNRPVVTGATPPVRSASPVAETHSVPQAPATLGVHSTNSPAQATGAHTVPRPPATYAGSNQGTANTSAHVNSPNTGATNTPAHVNSPNTGVKQAEVVPPTQNPAQAQPTHTVPKPPYAGGSAPHDTASAPHANYGSQTAPPPSREAASATRPPAQATHTAPPPKQQQQPKESNPKEQPKSNPGTASAPVPRPPAGYSYHAAPSSSASSSYAGGSSSGGSRSYSAPASTGSSSATYSSAPAYRSSGSYAAAPAYNARASAPAVQHYSAPPAPHYSGGNGGGHSGGGGGNTSHASSGHEAGHSR